MAWEELIRGLPTTEGRKEELAKGLVEVTGKRAGVNSSPHTHALESPQTLLQISLVLILWGTNLRGSHPTGGSRNEGGIQPQVQHLLKQELKLVC